jgi:hypothetical protein
MNNELVSTKFILNSIFALIEIKQKFKEYASKNMDSVSWKTTASIVSIEIDMLKDIQTKIEKNGIALSACIDELKSKEINGDLEKFARKNVLNLF